MGASAHVQRRQALGQPLQVHRREAWTHARMVRLQEEVGNKNKGQQAGVMRTA